MPVKFAVFSVFMLVTFSVLGSEAEPLEQLKVCARIVDQNDRINCYEALGRKVLENENNLSSASSEPPTPTTQPAPLPDSIGGGEFATAAGVPKETYSGHVSRCQKSADRRWFYIFDNGQVWKQVDRRRRSHKECDFDVTLTKDAFGYLMQITGSESEIRVNRIR